MFCKYCGKPISEGAKYCGHCGENQNKQTITVAFVPKSVLCLFVSVITEIIVIIASFMDIVNVEISSTLGMLTAQKNIISVSVMDIMDSADVIKTLSNLTDTFEEYSGYLYLSAYIVFAGVVLCAIYLAFYLTRYNYSGSKQSDYNFGKDYRRYSFIPSLIMALLMIIINIICAIGMNDYNDYIKVMPAAGTVLVIICAIIHIAISVITKETTSKNAINAKDKAQKKKAKKMGYNTWTCDSCGATNQSGSIAESMRCKKCGKWREQKNQHTGIVQKKEEQKGATWKCDVCNTINSKENIRCTICGKWRDS